MYPLETGMFFCSGEEEWLQELLSPPDGVATTTCSPCHHNLWESVFHALHFAEFTDRSLFSIRLNLTFAETSPALLSGRFATISHPCY